MASVNARNGLLYLDFRYKGQRCREYTKLADTVAHRKRLEKVGTRIEVEIILGTFVYRNYFPDSKRADVFEEYDQKVEAARKSEAGEEAEDSTPTLAEFAQIWLSEKQVEWRDSHYTAVVGTLQAYAMPTFGEKKLNDITKAEILQFRATLAKDPLRKSSALKASTVNKAITPFRMIMNEAAERYTILPSPFLGVKSLKIQRTDIEPFSLDEVNLFL